LLTVQNRTILGGTRICQNNFVHSLRPMDSELLTYPNPKIAPEEWQHTPSSVQQMILQMAQRLPALEGL
jgi:hypothetical protein